MPAQGKTAKNDEKMKYTITIPIWTIVDQVNAKVHYMARSASESAQAEATLSELSEGENEDMIASSLDKALAALSGIIGLDAPNTYERTEDFGAQNVDEDGNAGEQEQTATYHMQVPRNFDTGTGKALQQAMIHYCIGVIMQDWVSVVLPANTDAYIQEQAKAAASIRELMKKRVRPQYEDETPVLDTTEIVYNGQEE